MASKVIGFRVPEDIAIELEKVSGKGGMTVTEFMRSLVDETLYPASDNKGQEKSGTVTLEQLESVANEHKKLVDQVESLSHLMNHIGVKIAKYETEGIISPEQVGTMKEVDTLKSKINSLEYRLNTTLITAGTVRDVVTLMKDNKVLMDRTYDELRKEMSLLGSQLGTMKDLPLKVERIETNVNNLTTNLPSTIRETVRQPTNETHTLTLKSGRERTFRVYKSPAGLVKPHRVVRDPISGNKYVDLNEPLD